MRIAVNVFVIEVVQTGTTAIEVCHLRPKM